MDETNFRNKVKELLEFVVDDSTPRLNYLLHSGCGFKDDIENEPEDSYLVAKAFVVQFLRRYDDVWASTPKVKEFVNRYEKF